MPDPPELRLEQLEPAAAAPSPGAAGEDELADLVRRFRVDYPEREVWIVRTNNGDGTFDLKHPDGRTLERVKALDPRARHFIFPPATVWVAYSRVDRNRPYIKDVFPGGRAGNVLEPIHRWEGVDQVRSFQNAFAGRPPKGIRLDTAWKTDPIGDARDEYPLTMVAGVVNGRPMAWIACAWGANGGNFSPGSDKRVTCFGLDTGETIWSTTVQALTVFQQNFPFLVLDALNAEVVVANQFSSGNGPIYFERLDAFTGKSVGGRSVGTTEFFGINQWELVRDMMFAGAVSSSQSATLSQRVQIFRRAEAGAYAPAEQIWLPTGRNEYVNVASGGADLGHYWPEGNQLLLNVLDRYTGANNVKQSSKLVALEASSLKMLWTYDPYSDLGGIDPYLNVLPLSPRRDTDGFIYMVIDEANFGPNDFSHLVKLDPVTGRRLWKTTLVNNNSGSFWDTGSWIGFWRGYLLTHRRYKTGAVTRRPVLVDKGSGNFAEGPDNWRLWTIEPAWNDEWLWNFFTTDSGAGTITYRIVGPGWRELASVTEANGLARHARVNPTAGPSVLFDGSIYSPNWDAAALRWRVRRWN